MPQNTLALEQQSREKEALNGQSDQVSAPSVFWFPVYEGLFDHAPTMSDAVWFFMWLIARTTREKNGGGSVLGGVPIRDGRPAGELGFPVKTIRRWRRMLVKGAYIAVVRTPYGFKYTLLKSKKWQKEASRDCPKLPISLEESARNRQSDLPLRAVRVPETGTLIRQYRDNTEEEAEDAAAAASPSLKGKSRKVFKEAWDAIGIEPSGSIRFCEVWEYVYGESTEGEQLTDVMERAIQHCQSNGIRVPPPFFSAKRQIKKQESGGESDEVARMKTLSSADYIKELEWRGLMR